jgi:PHS family inorganic phosphate transporter-like MFS transporter
MKIYAFFMLLGCFLTLLIPETKRFTLEQMSAEEIDPASGITAEHTVERKSNGQDNNEKIAAP